MMDADHLDPLIFCTFVVLVVLYHTCFGFGKEMSSVHYIPDNALFQTGQGDVLYPPLQLTI